MREVEPTNVETETEVEIADLGDAKKETRQVYFGIYWDNQYGAGAYPGWME